MSLLAGIFSRSKDGYIDDSLCSALQNQMSRNPDDKPKIFRDRRCLLMKVDVNAYEEPAWQVDPVGHVSMLAGEPLLDVQESRESSSRSEDLQILHESLDRDDWKILTQTCGSFCAVHYQPEAGKIHLIVDKLGVRPLYYWKDSRYLIFASAIRILEGMNVVPKKMDLRAVIEMNSFGYPLGDRTPYCDIVRLKAGEIVEVTENNIVRSHYWRWDDAEPISIPESELLPKLYKQFTTAIDRRLRSDANVTAFLSGGLDTRCIVAVLRHKNVNVHTFTFANDQTQEKHFAREFARRVGTLHHEEPAIDTDVDGLFWTCLAAVLRRLKCATIGAVERPQVVWSGDGGSCGVGHIYISPRVVELLRSGNEGEAIKLFLREQGIHIIRRLFRVDVGSVQDEILREGIGEELKDIRCNDRGRAFHIFLMLNDQRRHLAKMYETIDIHRMEFQLPFYDGDFLQTILSTPVDFYLGHKLYNKWLNQFPAPVKSVPWQSYPGHEPCCLEIPEGLIYQWDSYEPTRKAKNKLLRDATRFLLTKDFPDALLNRRYLLLTSLIHWTGLRNYKYVMNAADQFYKYWRMCNGKCSL
jgi:asparagine synthase (glutamine-hydrolysing)